MLNPTIRMLRDIRRANGINRSIAKSYDLLKGLLEESAVVYDFETSLLYLMGTRGRPG